MPPSRRGRKRFFHQISEDTEEASLHPADVTMDDMAPMSNALEDRGLGPSEVVDPQDALSSEGTMRQSSLLFSSSTLVNNDIEHEVSGVALSSNCDMSSSTLAHDSTASTPDSLDPSPSSPHCRPASPYTLAANDSEPYDPYGDANRDNDPDQEDEVPPFCNYLSYCDYFPQTTIPLATLSPSRIGAVFAQFEDAHPSYHHNLITAYLSETTFTAKVWINFDPSPRFADSDLDRPRNYQGFYTDRRAEDTGILHLPCSTRTYLQSLDPEVFRFQHMRVEICTPFRPLATLNLDFTMKESLEGFEFAISGEYTRRKTVAGFSFFKEYIEFQAENIRQWVKEDDLQGLNMSELESIALAVRQGKELGDGECNGWMKEPCRGGGDWTEPEHEAELATQTGGWDGYVPFVADDVVCRLRLHRVASQSAPQVLSTGAVDTNTTCKTLRQDRAPIMAFRDAATTSTEREKELERIIAENAIEIAAMRTEIAAKDAENASLKAAVVRLSTASSQPSRTVLSLVADMVLDQLGDLDAAHLVDNEDHELKIQGFEDQLANRRSRLERQLADRRERQSAGVKRYTEHR
nr:hypothetical protein B0A51_10606 [Rachicladosporium sp. CCFEE 5018]